MCTQRGTATASGSLVWDTISPVIISHGVVGGSAYFRIYQVYLRCALGVRVPCWGHRTSNVNRNGPSTGLIHLWRSFAPFANTCRFSVVMFEVSRYFWDLFAWKLGTLSIGSISFVAGLCYIDLAIRIQIWIQVVGGIMIDFRARGLETFENLGKLRNSILGN